jgi:hypothetical protein
MAQLPKVAWIAIAGLTGCGAHVAEPAPTPSHRPSGTAQADPIPGPTANDPEEDSGDPTESPAPVPTAVKENTQSPAPAPTAVKENTQSPAQVAAAIDENLAKLRALEIFEVGDLIAEMPAEALNCYGPKPCAGSEPAVDAARATAAERLTSFTGHVLAAAATPYDSYACEANIEVNLEALRSLRVVDVGSFLRSEPANSMFCYNMPCQSDIDAANAANHDRAAQLESIAISLPKL